MKFLLLECFRTWSNINLKNYYHACHINIYYIHVIINNKLWHLIRKLKKYLWGLVTLHKLKLQTNCLHSFFFVWYNVQFNCSLLQIDVKLYSSRYLYNILQFDTFCLSKSPKYKYFLITFTWQWKFHNRISVVISTKNNSILFRMFWFFVM